MGRVAKLWAALGAFFGFNRGAVAPAITGGTPPAPRAAPTPTPAMTGGTSPAPRAAPTPAMTGGTSSPAMTGGAAMTAALNKIVASAGGTPELRVGFLAGSTEPDGTPTPLVAFWNEFGTGRIPPRPFFRTMIAAKKGTWGADVAKVFKATGFDTTKTLMLMGDRIQRQLQQSIVDMNTPPLAASTIAKRLARGAAKRKGFNMATATKPLIDSGTMWNNVDYEVSP